MPDASVTEYASRRRLTADERRARILSAARTEFARAGYHGASTASIARAAGCSEPMLYKHFVGKQALFVVNLPPKQMAGVTSEGMLFDLGYGDGVRPALAVPEFAIPNGTRAG